MGNMMNNPMRIDPGLTANRIQDYMRRTVQDNNADGIILGLSGGLDSMLLATLAVKALGKDKVHAYFLGDRDSDKRSLWMARKGARWLGIDLRIRPITSVMKRQRVYSTPIMKVVKHSRRVNQDLINATYARLFGDTPFMTTLKMGAGEYSGSGFQSFMYNNTVQRIENGFYARHRFRKVFLEKEAKKRNLVLMGAANLSECEMGWFVKDGVDDLPISPMMCLYKTQVRQLARYLGIPRPFISQAPSPDMIKGITDEMAMGVLYSRIDFILDGFDKGVSDSQLIKSGIKKHDIQLVREIHKYSEWKRRSYHVEPPVDGRLGGGLRV